MSECTEREAGARSHRHKMRVVHRVSRISPTRNMNIEFSYQPNRGAKMNFDVLMTFMLGSRGNGNNMYRDTTTPPPLYSKTTYSLMRAFYCSDTLKPESIYKQSSGKTHTTQPSPLWRPFRRHGRRSFDRRNKNKQSQGCRLWR